MIAMENKFDLHKAKTVWDNIGVKLMKKGVRVARQFDQLRPVGYWQPMWSEMFEDVAEELQSLKQSRLSA